MKDSFQLGDTEFGIDRRDLKLSFTSDGAGRVVVKISVAGDPKQFELLTEAVDGDWSWALYPPVFHLDGFRISQESAAAALSIEVPDETETFEMALYMMEHCRMSGVTVRREAEGILIEGRVDVFGDEMPLRLFVDDRSAA